MNVSKVSHIGIAVKSIDEQIQFFKDVLGLELTGVEVVEEQKSRVAFLKVGETRIELIEPAGEGGAIEKFLQKRDNKPGIHHVALEVDDLEKALAEAAEKGVKLIDEKPRIGAGGVRIAFLHPKSTAGVLTELCEKH